METRLAAPDGQLPTASVGLLCDAVAAAPPRCGDVTVVAIDGGAASGKTTLALRVARFLDDAAVLHTDDLLDGWQDQFTFWPRLNHTVLQPLASGFPARFPRFDWNAGRFASDEIALPPPKVLIVEGVSAIEACGDWLSLGVLIELSRPERERRWSARDGVLPPEATRWLDAEDEYFARSPTGPRFTTPAPLIRLC